MTMQDVLKEGRKHEAAALGTQQLQNLHDSIQKIYQIKTKKHCGLYHKYRQCPAYKDTCKAYGNKGHWQKMCRQSRDPDRMRKWKKQKSRKVHNMEANYDDDSSSITDMEEFHNIKMSNKCLGAIATRDEAFTTVNVSCSGRKPHKLLRLKIDTEAQGNALPIRQMYGNIDTRKILTPIGQTKFTAYTGGRIKCFGSMTLTCKSGSSNWVKAIFYVVDVRGPVVQGLPTCEALGMVAINCHVETLERTTKSKPLVTVEDLKVRYPAQFDTVWKFKKPAAIILKHDAEPHIDRPIIIIITIKVLIYRPINRDCSQALYIHSSILQVIKLLRE